MSNEGLIDLVKERLAPLGEITVRKTFGELAVYVDKRLVGLILDGELYLKTDAATASEYEGRGAFSYEMNGKTVITAYRQVPDETYDDTDEMLRRAGDALRIVLAKRRWP